MNKNSPIIHSGSSLALVKAKKLSLITKKILDNIAFIPSEMDQSANIAITNSNSTINIFNKKPFVLTGHADSVSSLAITPDGKILCSGSNDGTIKLFEISTGQEIASLDGRIKRVRSLAITPDGRTLCCGGFDGRIVFWDLETKQQISEANVNHLTVMKITPDGNTLCVGASFGDTITLLDIPSGRKIQVLEQSESFGFDLAISPDGRTLCTGNSKGKITLWDIQSGRELTSFQDRSFPHSICFTPDGNTLCIGHSLSQDDIATRYALFRQDIYNREEGIRLWDVHKKCEKNIYLDYITVNRMLLGYDGKMLFIVGARDDYDYMLNDNWSADIKVYNFESKQEEFILQGHKSPVQALEISKDGKILCTGSHDGTIKIWDLQQHKEIWTLWGYKKIANISIGLSSKAKQIKFKEKQLEWLIMTEDGYFNHSGNGREYISILDSNGYAVKIDDESYEHYFDLTVEPDYEVWWEYQEDYEGPDETYYQDKDSNGWR